MIRMNSKQFFLERVIEKTRNGDSARPIKLLDFGCGTASYVPALLEHDSFLTYVGIEPIAASFKAAEQNLAGCDRATVHFQLGYDPIPGVDLGTCDAVVSLSVLEHVKHLDTFIAKSAEYLRPGGLLVHRYDLGHALYTHSLKEWIHVRLGNNLPSVLPERQFVRYVPEPEVQALFMKHAVVVTESTYHQMPNLKQLEKWQKAHVSYGDMVSDVYEWEWKYQDVFRAIPTTTREKLFPSVAVWGIKQG